MPIVDLDHVQIAMPRGREDEARAFYGAQLGLAELPKPANLAARGGLWFQLGGRQLHLGVEEPFRPARKAHAALLVRGLTKLRADLEALGYHPRNEEPLEGADRFYLDDPFGNRLEFLEPIDGKPG
jgi:catechol 2,3-dioxygenase-like lactoylglutathione lyase family enzyme